MPQYPIIGRDDEFIGTITVKFNQWLGHGPDANQLAAFLYACQYGLTGEGIDDILSKEPESIAYLSRPKLPEWRIKGKDFLTTDGKRFVWNGVDQFRAFRLFLDGVNLDPLFQETRDLGFNLWRVFMQGSAAQNQVLDLRPTDKGYYDALRPFADALNAQGITLLATVYVDNQDVQAGPDHWSRLASYLRGSGTLLSGFNQWSKNKSWFGPDALSDPGMIWSRGSDVEDREVSPAGASFAEFHTRRDMPAMLMDTVASPVYLYGHGLTVPLIMSEPIGFAETDQPGRRSNDPELAWMLARLYSTLYSGVVFHSDAGIRSQLMGPKTRACAEAWVRGMMIP